MSMCSTNRIVTIKTDNGLEPPTVLGQATNQLQADGSNSVLEAESCKICITMSHAQQLCGLQGCSLAMV